MLSENVTYRQLNENVDVGDRENWNTLNFKEKKDAVLNSIHKVSGYGRYQKGLLISLFLALLGGNLGYGLIGYTTPTPKAICQKTKGSVTTMESCTEEEACSLISQGIRAEIVFTYENWTKEYKLYCDNIDHRYLGQSVLVLVFGTLSGLQLFFTEFYGRKLLVLSMSGLTVGGSIGVWLAPGYLLKCIFLGVACSCYNTLGPLASIAGSEYLDPTLNLGPYYVYIAVAGSLLGTVVLSLISFISLDSNFLVICSMFIMILTSLMTFFLFTESPAYLLSKHDLEGLMQTITNIRAMNGLQLHSQLETKTRTLASLWIKDEEARKVSKEETMSPLKRIFTNRKFLVNFIGLFFLGLTTNVLLNAQYFFVSELGTDSPSVNGLLSGIIPFVAFLVFYSFMESLDQKKWCIWIQIGLISLGGVVLIADKHMENSITKTGLYTLINGMVIPATNNLLYALASSINSELFPIELRGTAFSFTGLGVVCSMMTPWLSDLSISYGHNFVVGCVLPCFISLPLTFLLKKLN